MIAMTYVDPWTRALVEQVYGGPPFNIGDRVRHPDGRLVEITSGVYWGAYGVCNHWSWRAVLSDGTLAQTTECGYGWKAAA